MRLTRAGIPQPECQAEQLASKPGFVFMEAACHNIFKDPVGFEAGTSEHIETLKIARHNPMKHEI